MELVEEAKTMFRLLDADKSGFLEKDELAPIVHKWAHVNAALLNMSAESVVDDILSNMDIDKNGKIDLLEFIEGFDNMLYDRKSAELVKEKLLKAHHHLVEANTAAFKESDLNAPVPDLPKAGDAKAE
jgi:Ca2+-binding EF-hand superfamily protein